MSASPAAPAPGQTVLVRRRPAVVRHVEVKAPPRDAAAPRTHLVEVEYLDGWDHPRSEWLLWEIEPHARIVSRLKLPDLADPATRPDRPERFRAFLDAVTWAHAAHHSILEPEDRQSLLAPWQSAVQIEDYQLYPLWKSLLMPRVSLLLADDVGLGKTIEAGLILTELIHRRGIRRVLVLCPAALQRQWQEELRDKFHLSFRVLDRRQIDRIRREQGAEVNPWKATPRAITSMDFLAQEDVRETFRSAADSLLGSGGAPSAPWDVLIVDEAHNFSTSPFGEETLRTRMLRELNRYFEHRLFLTATPHNGYTWSFTGLLELLDPVRFTRSAELSDAQRRHRDAVMVRRLKSDLNRGPRPRFAGRQVEDVPVRLAPEEQALFAALRAYRRAGRRRIEETGGPLDASRRRAQARFFFSLLQKRLLSSAFAFARTWWQHVEGLELDPVPLEEAETARKSVEDAFGDDEEQNARELDAVQQTSAWLRPLAADLESPREAVTRALEALGWTRERVQDPFPASGWLPVDTRFDAFRAWWDAHQGDAERLILFTEARDTLAYLLWRLRRLDLDEPRVRTLYGGLDLEYREQLKAAFNDPDDPVRILVATDAASEGINLQETCHQVFHFDIPWNPMRMEQRNGRVDRHGQARDVLCAHFATQDDTDLWFLRRIARKIHDAREDLGSVGEVLAQAVEDHFERARGLDDAELERRIESARQASEERVDLDGADRGGEQAYEQVVARLRATELNLGLSPEALARLLAEALRLEGGELQGPDEAGFYRLRTVPPSWRTLVEHAFLIRRGIQAGARPRIVFDPRLLEEEAGGRRVFRPRADTVLLRLGHPLMQRALAVLRRAMWEDPERGVSPVRRWTVWRTAGLPSGTDALVRVHVLREARNQLREMVDAGLRPFVFALERSGWRHLPGAEPPPGEELEEGEVERHLETVRDLWPDFQPLLGELLRDEEELYRQDLEQRLARGLQEQRELEARRFAERRAELEAMQARSTADTRRRELERLRRRLDEGVLFEEQRQHLQECIARLEQESRRRFEPLLLVLEGECRRVLEEVLPARYALVRATLVPVAFELLVPPAR